MKSAIFIPKKCKVGFNKRSDTYTGKLGYVIYNDGKKWRKETSWLGWIETYIGSDEYEAQKLIAYNNDAKNAFEYAMRYGNGILDRWIGSKRINAVKVQTIEDVKSAMEPISKYPFEVRGRSNDPSINPIEFENEPMEGFVLNRKAGGGSSGWNSRQTYCRVYDPRGFEFELTIPNLLYILENATSIKGKGLEGKFVYGWEGKDLVLIPESAPEYADLVEFSKMQNNNIKKSELVLGGIYVDAQGNQVTYLGEGYKKFWRGAFSSTRLIWFNSKQESYGSIYESIETKDIKSIKKYTGSTDPNFATLVDKLEKENSYQKTKPEFELIENPEGKIESVFAISKSFICYIKNASGFSQIEIQRRNAYNGYSWQKTQQGFEYVFYTRGNNRETFNTIEEITKQYELWQLKTTK